MDIEKGIAYCGLACVICSENDGCIGCKNEGCENKEWCFNLKCCKEKGISGCWECEDFPCGKGLLEKLRIRAFSRFIKEYGEDKLVECLENNEKIGIVYHYSGQLVGDYDNFDTEEEIMKFILNGRE